MSVALLTAVIWLTLMAAVYGLAWFGTTKPTEREQLALKKCGVPQDRYVRHVRLRISILGVLGVPPVLAMIFLTAEQSMGNMAFALGLTGVVGWVVGEAVLRLLDRQESTRGIVSEYGLVRRAVKEGLA